MMFSMCGVTVVHILLCWQFSHSEFLLLVLFMFCGAVWVLAMWCWWCSLVVGFVLLLG